MNRPVIFILSSVLCLIWESLADEIRDFNILDYQEYQKYLKTTQDPDLFFSTNVKGSLHEYKSGLENEDIHLNVSQLIYKYGYKVEEHEVKTTDGYILTLIRIPNKGRVVFLMHGLLMSADDWVIAGPESGIAYLLANEGYDVWMGNARGNKHSRRHEIIAPSSSDFWDFSWDEIGRYDLPATIDYVLSVTNKTELMYVGHSQGATSFIVMCSELPEYNDKVSLMIALAPPAALPHLKSPFLNFLRYITFFYPSLLFTLAKEMGYYEFLPSQNLMQSFRSPICGREDLAEIVCSNIVFLICGFNAAQLNVTNLPVIFAHVPAGAATKQIEHYSQTIISGKFRQFEYSEAKNIELYGSNEPPEYQVEKITVPIAIFYSDNDWLVSVEDVQVLRERLSNVVEFYRIPNDYFNHIDYLYAKDLKELVFIKLLSLLKQH